VALRVPPAIGLTAHLLQGAQRVATDAVAGSSRAMPRSVAGLDADYLSRLLGRTVTSVSVIGGDAGTSSRTRLALTGRDVPASVFVKMPAATAATRLMGELGRLGETEVRFYAELSAELSGVPKSYGAAFDGLTGRYVLVLEDLPAEECEFPDTLHPLGPDQAASLVELLARVHATFWERPPAWVYSASGDDTSLLTGSLLKLSTKRLAERTDVPVDTGRFIDENYRAVARLTDAGPHTVMHGDAHPGNVYFRNGAAGLLDWQAVRRGHPSRELAYTLITGMTTEDRRVHQRDLLDEYRGALAAAGGPDLDRDEMWTRYRLAAQYAYAAPVITAGMGGMQDDGIAMEGARRGVTALDDLETVAMLRRHL
jgi:Phosphotransferase enzyme family